MDAQHLSVRLAKVAEYIPQGARLADIGSDHAYLPAHVLLNGRIKFAVAGEVAKGPYQNMLDEIERHDLAEQLKPRLANGMAAIRPADEIDTVSITGLGGRLMVDILNGGHTDGQQYQRLILQPNIDVSVVRQWLMEHNYRLVDEALVREDYHFYEILVAEPGAMQLSAQELQFGPFDLQRQPIVWQQYWRRELNRILDILANLKALGKMDTDAYINYQQQAKAIEGAFHYASSNVD